MSQYTKELNTMLNKSLMRMHKLHSAKKFGHATMKLDLMDISLLNKLHAEPQSLKELCGSMDYERAELGKYCSKLIKHGLLFKETDENDKRRVVLGLTPVGVKQLDLVNTQLQVPLAFANKGLTLNEEKAVLKYLSRLHQGLKQLEEN